ncbi:MAG: hypothetical protein C4583_06970 [Anaerolineaceae bacterium]|nr:MAG: hypothetical protein C4583_06970 [Anaerolineaceae bacterium]
MNKTLKWILGIVLVLVLIGAMFAIGYAWRAHALGDWMMPYGYSLDRPFDREWNSPMQRNWDSRMPDRWSHPMMTTRNFVPFGGFFLLGGLMRFALFFGLLYGAYWLGRRNARITLDSQPSAPVDTTTPPEADTAPAPRKRAKKTE